MNLRQKFMTVFLCAGTFVLGLAAGLYASIYDPPANFNIVSVVAGTGGLVCVIAACFWIQTRPSAPVAE